jgi:hypothetical protein
MQDADGPVFFWSDWTADEVTEFFGDADPMAYMAEIQRQGNNLECIDAARLREVARLAAS